MSNKKLLIIGHARHGKDTVANFLKELYGYSFQSSSEAAARIFIYDALKDKYGYSTPHECFEDRVNRRTEWYNLICDYNKFDRARLAKEILKEDDMYVGMRDTPEISACIGQGLFDLVIGVYDPRKPEEPKESFNIDIWKASDIIIPNSSNLDDLKLRVERLEPLIGARRAYMKAA